MLLVQLVQTNNSECRMTFFFKIDSKELSHVAVSSDTVKFK